MGRCSNSTATAGWARMTAGGFGWLVRKLLLLGGWRRGDVLTHIWK